MLATWVQAAAVLIAVAVAVWQIIEARRTRREEARAYVVILLEFHADRMWVPDLTVANLGRTAASDIRISYDPPIRSTFYDDLRDVEPFMQGGIATLVPGQRMTTIFDTMIDRPEDWEDLYTATVAFVDVFGKGQSAEFAIDLRPYRGIQTVTRKSIHDVHEQLAKLVTEVKHIRNGFGGPVPVRVRTERHYRRDEWVRRRFRSWRGRTVPDTLIIAVRLGTWLLDEVRAIREAVKRRLDARFTDGKPAGDAGTL